MTYSGSFFAGYTPPAIESGAILANRYRVMSTLGQGGFGRTYLASDSNRFNESCVLKEFAPQVQHPDYLQKAQDLFEREAGVLYRLEHLQIPRFRELFQTHHNDRDYLLLVQDYIQGETYRDLLLARQRQGVTFSEAEVTQLLRQLLPVLAYIHANGVIHRDISPDNLMRREADGLPILIDFGGVKQAAASVMSQFSQVVPQSMESTRLGKVGYAPPEQLQQGLVYPHSDLYALGVTALVLLTGQEPQALLNPHTLEWEWRSWITVSPTLAAVFDRLLVYRPSDRFPSATAVLLALNGNGTDTPADGYPVSAYPATSATIAIGSPQPSPIKTPTRRQSDASYTSSPTPPVSKSQWDPAVFITFLLFVMAIGIGSWVGVRSWLSAQSSSPPTPTPSLSSPPTIAPTPAGDWPRDQTLLQQAAQDNINPDFFRALVDDRFFATYGNQSLTLGDNDAPNRENWSRLGQEWLQNLKALPKPWRSTLGNFNQADFEGWVAEVNQKRLSSRSLITLVDNTFFQWFPDLSEGTLTSSPPLLQVWFSMANSITQDLRAGKTLKEIQIDANSFNGRVQDKVSAGQGAVYLANLQTGNTVRVTLTPENGNKPLRWSIYSPGGQTLLPSPDQLFWEGTLTESGFYEFVILAGDQDSPFSLDLIAEPPTPVTPSPTANPVPTPDATLPPDFNPIAPENEPEDDKPENPGTSEKEKNKPDDRPRDEG